MRDITERRRWLQELNVKSMAIEAAANAIVIGDREGHILWALCVMGVLAIMAQMCLTKGYSLAPAGQVGPFNYGNVVFAAFLGWVIWGETLDGLTLAGAVLTCSAGIIATYHSERPIKP